MKKVTVYLMTAVLAIQLAGCHQVSTDKKEQEVSRKIYSFHGEDANLSLTNGVIVLDGENDIVYGGNLNIKGKEIKTDISKYHTKLFLDEGEKEEILLDDILEHKDRKALDVLPELGKFSGDVVADNKNDRIPEYLELEMQTVDTSGKESTYRLHMEVVEVTGDNY